MKFYKDLPKWVFKIQYMCIYIYIWDIYFHILYWYIYVQKSGSKVKILFSFPPTAKGKSLPFLIHFSPSSSNSYMELIFCPLLFKPPTYQTLVLFAKLISEKKWNYDHTTNDNSTTNTQQATTQQSDNPTKDKITKRQLNKSQFKSATLLQSDNLTKVNSTQRQFDKNQFNSATIWQKTIQLSDNLTKVNATQWLFDKSQFNSTWMYLIMYLISYNRIKDKIYLSICWYVNT